MINKLHKTSLHYGILVRLTLMLASIVSCCISYSNTKQHIARDLNDAMIMYAKDNSELWTCPDTIAAICQMYEITHNPMIYQASNVNFRNTFLKNEAYFTLALVDKKDYSPKIQGNKMASYSIMFVPEPTDDRLAIRIQGFADCSMASIFHASDQTLPSILFTLSILSMASMIVWKRREPDMSETEFIAIPASPSLDGIKLTPMQRQFAQMLFDAPYMRVDKRTLCETLWGNKSNAEESLYTLVRRTKTALAQAGMEIVCNRGDSYELRVTYRYITLSEFVR